MDESIDLQRLTLAHVPSLTLFHLQNLGGKLTWLGPSHVRFFYEIALQQTDTFGWVALRNNEMVGFVFGSTNGGTSLGHIIRKNPPRWLLQALWSACRNPLAFLRVVGSVLRASSGDRPDQPELHYIAVRPDQRGHHIGKKLMHHFSQDLSTRGKNAFNLSVVQSNQPAILFYEKNGGQAAGDYETAGMKMRRFSFNVQQMMEKGA